MRVLVTGATGFIGKQVVRALVRRGNSVVATGRLSVEEFDGAIFESVNLFDQVDVDALLKKYRPRQMIHCAWDTTPGSYWTTDANLKWVAASLNLAQAFSRSGGQRAVFIGTSAEYSWDDDQTLCEHTSPLDPDSLYGICKHSLNQMLAKWAEAAGFSCGWGRVFCPFGPAEKPQRLIPKMITRLLANETIEFDSGSLIRDFLSVDQVADAFAALLDSNYQGSVNIGSGIDTSIRELLTEIATCLNRVDQLHFDSLPNATGQPPRIVADVRLLSDTVGWRPSKSLKEQVAETCHWYVKTQSKEGL